MNQIIKTTEEIEKLKESTSIYNYIYIYIYYTLFLEDLINDQSKQKEIKDKNIENKELKYAWHHYANKTF